MNDHLFVPATAENRLTLLAVPTSVVLARDLVHHALTGWASTGRPFMTRSSS